MSAIQKVDNISFEEFLSRYKKLFIPAFQRPYSWQAKQIATLWDSIVSSDPHYYVGTLVGIFSKKEDGLEIIDGQQRLTTLMLFFVALRDYLEKISLTKKAEFSGIQKKIEGTNKYLWSHDEFSDKKHIRLRFNKRNLVQIFELLVEGKENLDPDEFDGNQKKFLKNYAIIRKQIREYFKTYSEAEKEEAFKSLTDKIRDLEFIVIVCKSDSDAFQLFEGLNSTGLDLSIVDLLKNAVLKAVNGKSEYDEEILREAEGVWNDMEEVFEERDVKLFSRFVRHQWIAKRGYISNNKLFDEIKSKELNDLMSAKNIIQYEKELLKDAKTYLNIRFFSPDIIKIKKLAQSKDRKKVLEYLEMYSLLNVEQAYEVLLALFNKFQTTPEYTAKQLFNDVRRLWNFAFKTRFLSISPASYENIFANFCKNISGTTKKSIHNDSEKFFSDLAVLIDSNDQEQEFIKTFASDFKYTTADRNLIKYVLKKIYALSNPTIEISDPSIDHFMPQNPINWGTTKDSVEGFVHNVGNLALLNTKENQSLQDSALKERISKVYARSEFKENKVFVELADSFAEDPENAIRERGMTLGKKVFQSFTVKK